MTDTLTNRICLIKAHPYGDRIIKRHETLEEYFNDSEFFGSHLMDTNPRNFAKNDGINAEIIWNSSLPRGNFSYCLVCTPDDSEEGYAVKSRWFVMDTVELRKNQYRIRLRRDIIADKYVDVIKSPMFIEKTSVPYGNKFLYNSEGMIFNKIKKSEKMLPDKTKMAWIVGYYAKNVEDKYLKGSVAINSQDDTSVIEISTTLANWSLSQYTASSQAKSEPSVRRMEMRAYFPERFAPTGGSYIAKTTFNDLYSIDDDTTTSSVVIETNISLQPFPGLTLKEGAFTTATAYKQDVVKQADGSKIQSDIVNQYGIKSSDFYEILSYDGKIIKDTAGKYYKCTAISTGTYSTEENVEADTTLFNDMNSWQRKVVNASGESLYTAYPTKTDKSYRIYLSGRTAYLQIDELVNYGITFDMTGNKLITEDSGYNIFAIPYPLDDKNVRLTMITDKGSNGFVKNLKTMNLSKSTSIAIAQSIATTMGNNLYDVQLLPYCPMQDEVDEYTRGICVQSHIAYGGSFKSKSNTYSCVGKPTSDGSAVDPNADMVGIVLYAKSSRFSFTIDAYIKIPADMYSARDLKVANECDSYRLVSPNYQGTFEFSVAKNGGEVYGFNVDCAYKPYSPYIHVAPNFGEMYGQDFNDARGLTCSGDFSLDIVSDAWQQYQINNKNYENIFNRQIENMDFNRGQERIRQAFGLASGTLQGGMSGAMAGGLTMGVPGAIAGATVGTVSSLAGGIADWAMSESAYKERRDYAIDNYQFTLGNVQALPYTLTKVSTFNPNSKYVPFIEYYSCSDEEREAMIKKIQYDGMSAGFIDTISNYITGDSLTFIRGQLVRYEGKNADEHDRQAVVEELSKGVYI